jgi:predicted transglutaminase-like cysteine proteinase
MVRPFQFNNWSVKFECALKLISIKDTIDGGKKTMLTLMPKQGSCFLEVSDSLYYQVKIWNSTNYNWVNKDIFKSIFHQR